MRCCNVAIAGTSCASGVESEWLQRVDDPSVRGVMWCQVFTRCRVFEMSLLTWFLKQIRRRTKSCDIQRNSCACTSDGTSGSCDLAILLLAGRESGRDGTENDAAENDKIIIYEDSLCVLERRQNEFLT